MYKNIKSQKFTYETFLIVINDEIFSKSELIKILYAKINSPCHFGENWDALFDTLTNLSWLNHQEIILIHNKNILIPENQLEIYYKILEDVSENWARNNERVFKSFLTVND